MTKAALILGSTVALLSSKAMAHYPTLDCQLDQQEVVCVAARKDISASLRPKSNEDQRHTPNNVNCV